MVATSRLIAYINELLKTNQFKDYCPNGLQVEGGSEVRSIVSGVTASLALIEAAVERGADTILVHHGYFWRGEALPIIGMKYRRLKQLIENDISLLAYHLPLDAHPELGNNAQLAALLGFCIEGSLDAESIGLYGHLDRGVDVASMAQLLENRLQRRPLVIDAGPSVIRRIGFCTGAAQGYIEQAAALGLDAYISGEISEHTVHAARELGIHYFAAGHHATERLGVQALGRHLSLRFGVAHEFVDIENPV